jgi:hypothetical protein
MHGWQFWAIYLVVMAVVIAIVIPVNRRNWRRKRTESGLNDWVATASTLSWRDRWRLAWSTTTGRAVSDPSLAALAARRATVAQDMLGRVRPRLKWIWIGLGLLWLAEGVFNLLDQQWFLGTLFLILAAGAAFMPQLAHWDARRAGRSAEANRRLADRT